MDPAGEDVDVESDSDNNDPGLEDRVVEDEPDSVRRFRSIGTALTSLSAPSAGGNDEVAGMGSERVGNGVVLVLLPVDRPRILLELDELDAELLRHASDPLGDGGIDGLAIPRGLGCRNPEPRLVERRCG